MCIDNSSSSSSLFSSLLEPTIQPNPNLLPPQSQPLPDSLDDNDGENIILDKTALNLFNSPSPILSSTPRPGLLTQELVNRMLELRRVDGDVVADKASPAFLAMRQEMDDLKSQLLAATIQIQELQDQLLAQSLQRNPPPPSNSHPTPPPNNSHPAPIDNSRPLPSNESRPPTNAVNTDDYCPAFSKKKKQKMRKRERLEAAADTTRPPGCVSVQLPPSPPSRPLQQHQASQQQQPTPQQQPPQQQQTSLPNLFIYHDSNLKGATAVELRTIINKINKDSNTPTTLFNIILEETYTLPQTLAKIQNTTYKNNDSVISTP